ncbi:hypothetical protein DERF_014808 [Dermatophagoides farinae]|uniref:Uncharacterized protein n=1 Tax=Dermatophagoides farinae TaxID=6954 RepID=A0A922HNM9_DERFA|nr:hypothetical protein DERF_014808 [Dermatophagoides farinae]
MSIIRWFIMEMFPYKNLDCMSVYLHRTKDIRLMIKNDGQSSSCDSARLINKLICYQILELIRYGFIYAMPLSHKQRIVMFDIFYLYNMSNLMNILAIIVTILGIYLLKKLYYELPERLSTMINWIVFKKDCRYFIHKNHKQNNVCCYIRGKLNESIMQNQIFVICLDLFTLYSLYIAINFIVYTERDYFLVMDQYYESSIWMIIARYVKIVLRITILFINVIVFDCANIMMAHCYMFIIYLFVFISYTFFLKLDQINQILNIVQQRTKIKMNPIEYRKTLLYFFHLHGHTLDHMNRVGSYESDLFTGYLIANLPMNLLLIITTFFLRKNQLIEQKGLYFFCTLVILQQIIGFFIVHLLCTIYTIKNS